jgi:hypothetical protein
MPITRDCVESNLIEPFWIVGVNINTPIENWDWIDRIHFKNIEAQLPNWTRQTKLDIVRVNQPKPFCMSRRHSKTELSIHQLNIAAHSTSASHRTTTPAFVFVFLFFTGAPAELLTAKTNHCKWCTATIVKIAANWCTSAIDWITSNDVPPQLIESPQNDVLPQFFGSPQMMYRHNWLICRRT